MSEYRSGIKFIKESLMTFSTPIVGVVLGMISTIVIARVLGPSDRGAYSLVILINNLTSIIGNSGLAVSNLYLR